MGYFDTFMWLTILEEIFGGLKDLATSPETAKWFWGVAIGLIAALSIALFIVSVF